MFFPMMDSAPTYLAVKSSKYSYRFGNWWRQIVGGGKRIGWFNKKTQQPG
jgi:hypothetical protein